MSEFTPAPAFRVDVTVFAWTEKQAGKIRTQVENMFAGSEISVTANIPPPADPVAAIVAEPVAAVVVPAAPVAPPPPPPRIVPEGSPVQFDQLLRDMHSGAIVKVTDISDGAFAWENVDADAAANAKTGLCPFVSFAACYEIPRDDSEKSEAKTAPADTESNPASMVDSPTHETARVAHAKKHPATHKPHATRPQPVQHHPRKRSAGS